MKKTNTNMIKSVGILILVGFFIVLIIKSNSVDTRENVTLTQEIYIKENQESERERDFYIIPSRDLGTIDQSINVERVCYLNKVKNIDGEAEYIKNGWFNPEADESYFYDYYFTEFHVKDGEVNGYFENYPFESDSYTAKFFGYAFYDGDTIVLETEGEIYSEGMTYHEEYVYKYFPLSKTLQRGVGLTGESAEGTFVYADKLEISFVDDNPNIPCELYDEKYDYRSSVRLRDIIN